jgi:hypothetical protein
VGSDLPPALMAFLELRTASGAILRVEEVPVVEEVFLFCFAFRGGGTRFGTTVAGCWFAAVSPLIVRGIGSEQCL